VVSPILTVVFLKLAPNGFGIGAAEPDVLLAEQ
jgi:hypothetical protein